MEDSIATRNATINWYNNSCPILLQTLDFIYNFAQPDLEIIWPCEVRYYWLEIQPLVNTVRFLIAYITPIIIILGLTLNTVSFVILSTSVPNDSNLSLYLRALALSDNGALIFNYTVSIAKSHISFVNNLFMESKFLCGMSSVVMVLFHFSSTWLVVSLTWARVGAVIFPLQSRDARHDRCAIITIIVVICLSFIASLTKLYTGGYDSDSIFEFVPCHKKVTPWGSGMYFHIAFATWLPLLFIFTGNLFLIIRMRRSDKIRSQLTGTQGQNTIITQRTSRMLFAVSIVYLVLLLPFGIVTTLELYWDVILVKYPAIDEEAKVIYINWLNEKMLLKWWRGLFFHLYQWNFAINFFLYYLTGKKFRNHVLHTFRCSKKRFYSNLKCCITCAKVTQLSTSTRSTSISLIKIQDLKEQPAYSNNSSVWKDSRGSIIT